MKSCAPVHSRLTGDKCKLADPSHSAIRVGDGRHHGNVFELFELHLEACGVLLRISNRLRLSRPPCKQAVVTTVERPYACNRRLESNPCRGRLTSWANQSTFIAPRNGWSLLPGSSLRAATGITVSTARGSWC